MDNPTIVNELTKLESANASSTTHWLKQLSHGGMVDGIMCVYQAGECAVAMKAQASFDAIKKRNMKRTFAIAIIFLSMGAFVSYALYEKNDQYNPLSREEDA